MYWNMDVEPVREVDLSKRFWIFAHADYEANCGMKDIRESVDTLEEGINMIQTYGQMPEFTAPFCIEEGHIYDSHKKEIVAFFNYRQIEGFKILR